MKVSRLVSAKDHLNAINSLYALRSACLAAFSEISWTSFHRTQELFVRHLSMWDETLIPLIFFIISCQEPRVSQQTCSAGLKGTLPI